MRPWAIRCGRKSPVYLAWPVTSATPSTLGIERPSRGPSAAIGIPGGLQGHGRGRGLGVVRPLAHPPAGVQQRGHDPDVAGTAADVADQRFAGRLGILVEEHPDLDAEAAREALVGYTVRC